MVVNFEDSLMRHIGLVTAMKQEVRYRCVEFEIMDETSWSFGAIDIFIESCGDLTIHDDISIM